MNNSQKPANCWMTPALAISICSSLLISLSFSGHASAMPFMKKDADKEDGEGMSLQVAKIKLTKDQQTEFDTSMKNGNAYLKANNFELALICYMRCSTLDPSNVNGHLGLAYCHVGLCRDDQAKSEIFEALRCDGNNTKARYLLGQIMMNEKLWDEAGGQFFQVLKVLPDDLGARGNLATCLQMLGQMDAAVGQYKYILEKDPKRKEACLNLAAAYFSKGAIDDASSYYKKVIELDHTNTNAYCMVAKCLIVKKDFKDAQVMLTEACKLTPNNYYVHLMQGYLNEKQSKTREAIEEYTKAVALAPQDPDSQRSLQHMIEISASNSINSRSHGSVNLQFAKKAHNSTM